MARNTKGGGASKNGPQKSQKTATKSKSAGQDAIALLKEDHKKVKRLLQDLEESDEGSESAREDLVATIAEELQVHSKIEEEIFYPAFRDASEEDEDKEMYFEALEEHGLVDIVLPQLQDLDPSDETFAAKAKVLKDLVEHHVEEEEGEMFPRARKLLGEEELLDLGSRLSDRKEELKAEGPEARVGAIVGAKDISVEEEDFEEMED